MKTPVWDFVKAYTDQNGTRFHMPGHKGTGPLGCEKLDITEVTGADALYEAEGIIGESEKNATELFDSGRTLYSTEGSSQCIRAMLSLVLTYRNPGCAPEILAARNVHKAFVYGAGLLDCGTEWLWPEETDSLCSCPVSPELLEKRLSEMSRPPAAVYVTSPDYLGNLADIGGLAEVCHRHGTMLAVDNAHGAYLHFLEPSLHPLDLGADICCDSAHKTLPVLTGGAYLHLSKRTSEEMRAQAKNAMALFGSTSPSYLILSSLDLCNRYLSDGYRDRLAETVKKLTDLKARLREKGWEIPESDPLRLTLRAPRNLTGTELADLLRRQNIECEYADPEFAVLMVTEQNRPQDFERLEKALTALEGWPAEKKNLPPARGERALSIRQALLAPREKIPAREALGRICGAPTVACPPAIPVAVSGERIGNEALTIFSHYGIETVDVVK